MKNGNESNNISKCGFTSFTAILYNIKYVKITKFYTKALKILLFLASDSLSYF
jgi:hypothetical protein